MTNRDEELDARLDRLRLETQSTRPNSDFGLRVMQTLSALQQQTTNMWDEVLRPARLLLPAAAITTAIAIVWAAQSARMFDDALSTTADDVVELAW